ncbi:MAG: hypothetical protein R2745_08525 [Vicinamibacterales bacterium]
MTKVAGFDVFPLHFDGGGARKTPAEFDALKAHVTASGATDLVTIAHGFRNSEHDASTLYEEFLTNFRAHLARPELAALNGRRFVVAGVFWPSKAFAENAQDKQGGVQGLDGADGAAERAAVEAQLRDLLDDDATADEKAAVTKALGLLDTIEHSRQAQDELVDTLLTLAGTPPANDDDGLTAIRAQAGSDVLAKLDTPILLPTAPPDDGDGGVTSVGGATGGAGDGGVLGIGGFFASVFGKVGTFLNLTTWYLMKNRSGTVGIKGLAPVIRELKAAAPALRVHVVGHSLGGRLSAACAKALSAAPMLQPDSLSLLEAAFSHYGFAADNGDGRPGFFRDVLGKKVVRGPLISTYSMQDTVVGTVYAVASRLADDNVNAIGDEHDKYGGIGRNGTQKTAEHFREALHTPGAAYALSTGIVHDLDGSGGLITSHGDVRNPAVTYAVASAIAAT